MTELEVPRTRRWLATVALLLLPAIVAILLALGEALDSHKDGQPLAARFFEAEVEGWQLSGISGAWHCPASGRSFVFTYATLDERTPRALQSAFEAALAGLACHGPPE